jgi:general secretion pathway protein G
MSGFRLNGRGFSLVELMVVIVVIGILAAVAMQSMTALIRDSRRSMTEREMQMLARAIVGDPSRTNAGARCDFGYVGDIGAFPPDLQALYRNPGGYSTWSGPYVELGVTQDTVGFMLDEWGAPYTYSGDIVLTSIGGGSAITTRIAGSVSDYVNNTFNGTVLDDDGSVPGLIYQDSVTIEITVPDGSGAMAIKGCIPESSGAFSFDSLPAGRHLMRIIYEPAVDTFIRYVTILPRHKSSETFKLASAYFSGGGTGGGLTKVPGSDSIAQYSPQCNGFSFWIENATGGDVTITSITLSWSSPTAYYQRVTWAGSTVVFLNPKTGPGETATFSSPQTIADGASVRISVEAFKDRRTGGSNVNMQNTAMTVELSDGSSFDVTLGGCP